MEVNKSTTTKQPNILVTEFEVKIEIPSPFEQWPKKGV